MPRPSSDKAIPFLPEGVANPYIPSQPWQTFESTPIEARVNLHDCMAFVPRNVNEYTDLIHWHELGHVKWTEGPGVFGKTEPGAWDHMLREPQVNILLLRQLRVDVCRAMRAFDFADHPVPLLPRDAGLLWINLAYYLKDPDNENLREFAGRLEARIREGWEGDRAFQTCMDAVNAVVKDPTPSTRMTWAVKLAEYFNPPPPTPTLTPDVEEGTADEIKEQEEEAKEEDRKLREAERQDVLDQLGKGSRIDNMEIHEHITHSRPGKRIAAPGGVRDTGIIPVKFDRYCTDKMIFQIRKPTGSLLIDCSGSMAWDWEALREGLKAFPNVTVGCYQGMGAQDLHGRLCVIARKGRWSDYTPFREPGDFNYGNTVDYQALLWLSKLPRPRLWLSDGGVCGGNRMNTPANCDAQMRRGKILRVESLQDALRYFGRKEVAAFTDSRRSKPVVTRRRS